MVCTPKTRRVKIAKNMGLGQCGPAHMPLLVALTMNVYVKIVSKPQGLIHSILKDGLCTQGRTYATKINGVLKENLGEFRLTWTPPTVADKLLQVPYPAGTELIP